MTIKMLGEPSTTYFGPLAQSYTTKEDGLVEVDEVDAEAMTQVGLVVVPAKEVVPAKFVESLPVVETVADKTPPKRRSRKRRG